MAKTLLNLFMVLLSSITIAQEICDNGIDDDGDMLIDLNDSECECVVTTETSIIPNHSFENYTQCPTVMGAVNYAYPWVYFNFTTSDYFNCNFFAYNSLILQAGLENYPDGTGAIGTIWHVFGGEWPGTILSEPMLAGTDYQLTFHVAVMGKDTDYNFVNAKIFEPIMITLYGTNEIPTFPYPGNDTPSATSPAWSVIGEVLYTPQSKWGEVTMMFTPEFDVNAISIGQPEEPLPSSYYYTAPATAYFLYDNFILKTASEFGVNISGQGDFCSGNLVLSANITLPFSNPQYQWFLEGVALPGATNAVYSVPNNPTAIGNYSVRISNSTGCYISSDYITESYVNQPQVSIIHPTCLPTGTITVIPTAAEYSFDDGITWQTSPVSPALPSGTYKVRIKLTSGCISAARNAVINAPVLQNPPIFYVIPPTCETGATITIQTTATQYSFDDGTTWTNSNVATNIPSGTYHLRIKNAAGCVSFPASTTINPPVAGDPVAAVTHPFCNETIGSITITAVSGAEYSFDGGITYQTSNIATNLPPGDYPLKIRNSTCESPIINVTINDPSGIPPAPVATSVQTFCVSNTPTVQFLVATGQNIIWYDSATALTPLPATTQLSDGMTYYASQTVIGCESVLRFAVTVDLINDSLVVNSQTIGFCDDAAVGSLNIDLSDYEGAIAGSVVSPTFSYYSSLASAENAAIAGEIQNIGNYPLTTGTVSVFVRVDAPSGCFAIAELQLSLYPSADPMMDAQYGFCEGSFVSIQAASGYSSYLWSTGQTTPSINVQQAGNYSVQVTKNHNTISCTATDNFEVVLSNSAEVSQIITSDWTDSQNSITVVLSGDSVGDYEYSIDGTNYQESNIFTGLSNGTYTVYIRDKNDCGIAEEEFYLMMYPAFFSPNGDGHNDYWHIEFSDNEPKMQINIYDRYGKLIKYLLPGGDGWDGTLDGERLPATDYWFSITRQDGVEHRGHFSLIR